MKKTKSTKASKSTTAVATVEPVKAVPLTDDQAANAIRQQYQVVIRAEAATFRERVRFGGMLLQWEQFLGKSHGGCKSDGDGLKGWLEKNCSELGYNAAMGYKTMAERAIKMLGGGAVVTAALLGEKEVSQPDGEVIDVQAEVIKKCDEFFEKADSRRKLEQMWFEFTNGEGKPGKKRSKGLDVGEESAPALTAAQEAHAEWSRLFLLKPRFSKMMSLARSLTVADASDALELLRPLMDSLKARVKEG